MSGIVTQIVVPIVTLIIGAWLGAWSSAWIKRPKLTIVGAGSGGATWVSVSNRPGILGITLNETMLLGKRIHSRVALGPSFERATANTCRGIIFDKSDGHALANLYWRSIVDGQTSMTLIADIKSGERLELMIVARQSDEPDKYFIYEPKRTDSFEAKVPPDHAKLSGTRTFTVRITYSDHSKLEFDYTVRQEYGGRLSIQCKHGGGSF